MADSAKRVKTVVTDMSAMDLGDVRLDFRGRRVLQSLAGSQERVFPNALPTEAELEGL